MSDLDRRFAEAAKVAAKLKADKWSGTRKEPPATAAPSVRDRTGGEGRVTPARERVLKEAIAVASKAEAATQADKIRRDLNEVIDNYGSDVDKAIAKVRKQIEGAAAARAALEKMYAEIQPRQLVVQGENETTELGVVDGAVHKDFDKLVKAVNVRGANGNRKNVILKGPAGSGKSTAGKQIAELHKLDFYYIGQTLMPHQIEGYVRQGDGVYVDTAFVRAFLKGGVVMLEEMDAWSPQATLVANPPLANGYMMLPNGEMIKRHKDCIIIACANTWGMGATAEYVGRNKLDAAFLDRFALKFDWGYDEELERKAAGNDDLVTKVQICRMNAQKAGIKVLISPRASIECADMVRAGFTEQEAFELNFLSSLSKDQRATVLSGVKYD